jgi:DNA-binding XRE family transcriptional regulator
MPNIGNVLRTEISRLALRTSRNEIHPTRRATAQHRRDIASLKRQVAQLERQFKLLARSGVAKPAAVSSDSAGTRVRFVAKGLRAQRNRLGLSAADFGKLVGVSPQSIYNWEQALARPRDEQISKLAALRSIGKREAGARLQQLIAATNGSGARKR